MAPSQPDLFVIYDKEWEDFVEQETSAAYEAIDNFLDRLCLNGTIDVVAGAYYDPRYHTIYSSETMAKRAFDEDDATALALYKHEKGHEEKVHLEDHPTKPIPMLIHGFKCGFDYRAGTRLLRLRKGTAPTRFHEWFKNNQRLWKNSILTPQHPPTRGEPMDE